MASLGNLCQSFSTTFHSRPKIDAIQRISFSICIASCFFSLFRKCHSLFWRLHIIEIPCKIRRKGRCYHPYFIEMGRLKNKKVEPETQVIILTPELPFHKMYEVNGRWKSSLGSDFKTVKSKRALRLIINYNALEREGVRWWNYSLFSELILMKTGWHRLWFHKCSGRKCSDCIITPSKGWLISLVNLAYISAIIFIWEAEAGWHSCFYSGTFQMSILKPEAVIS